MSLRSRVRCGMAPCFSLGALLLWVGAAPAAEGDSLKGKVTKIGDLTAMSLKLDGTSVQSCLFWDSEKGDAFIALDFKKGVIRRISCPDFKVLREKEVPEHPFWLCPS